MSIYRHNFVTIDPGKNGGAAWCDEIGDVYAAKCPDNIYKMLKLMKLIKSSCDKSIHCVIEKQGAMGQDTPLTAFSLSGNYHTWLTGMIGFKISITVKTARTWQKKTGVRLQKGRENYALRKKALKNYAIEGFPNGVHVWEYSEKVNAYTLRLGKITNANADALAMLRALGEEI